jgi:integrase
MRVASVRSKHLRTCIDTATAEINGEIRTATPVIKNNIKIVFNMMFDYAVVYEYTDKNYARMLNTSTTAEIKKEEKHHINFTDIEMSILWQHIDTIPNVDMILIQCYSGWRPKELIELKLENINLEEGYFIGGSKTEAGKNRKVPIHSKIFPLVKARYEQAKEKGNPYLFYSNKKYNTNVTYDWYFYSFNNIINKLNLNQEHSPHDCRVQFITMLKNAQANEYAIKRMAGHSIKDITESVYTKRDFSWLKEEIEKIKVYD